MQLLKVLCVSLCLCLTIHAENTDDGRETRPIVRYPDHDQVVPTMANSPGRFGAFFKTRVVIYNPTTYSYSIYATLYGPKGKIETKIINANPNSHTTWDNFLEEVFGYRGTGAVMFDSWWEPPGGSLSYEFSVYTEVYTESPNGRYSTVVVDGTGATRISLGTSATVDRDTIIADPGVTSNADQRINVGVFNDSSDYKTFYAIVGDGNGNTVETITLRVPAKAWAQKPVTSRMENGIIGWGCAESSCSAYPWVVTVNNQSNDGSLAQPIVYRP